MAVKVHLGCWHRNIPGFVNVDLCDMAHIHHKAGIDRLPMFADNSVDLIYSSHSLEYFDRVEVSAVLAEWRRVLKPGGILRVAVPDFESLIRVYKLSGTLNSILGPLYGRMEIQTEQGPRIIYHKTAYDFDSLSSLLMASGFNNVRRYDWRQTEHQHYDDHSQAYFPHMRKTDGILVSLNVEADKVE